jgi:hypothetical protein
VLLGNTHESISTSISDGYSAIYEKANRDHALEGRENASDYLPANYPRLEADYYGEVFGTIAHELGDPPGRQGYNADHSEGDLMKEGGKPLTSSTAHFGASSIRRFRTATSWTGGAP